jgi:hypothetical protein
MRHLSLVSAALCAALLLGAQPGVAQNSPQAGASGAASSAPETSARAPRKARPAKEPTVGQMAARERQRKCGAEWKEAKAANKTGGAKWPQFWSQCNARLKGNQA